MSHLRILTREIDLRRSTWGRDAAREPVKSRGHP
jgi:hypothetical protein